MSARIALVAVTVVLLAAHAAGAEAATAQAPIVLTGADRRPATSLDGDWAAIVDPYFSGLFSFHHEEKANGWFLNRKAQPGDTFPTEYDFAKAPTLKVSCDWNTQREPLLYYEGPIWYERDFTYQPREHTRIFLRGVAIHAEAPYRTGRATTDQDAETLLGWAKELDCNFVRLAHYPHDETMLRAADRMGLLVWSENPVYWALQLDNPKVLAKAGQQLDEEIGTSRNHSAIILWSMANETPNNEARTRFIAAALLVRAEGHTKIVDDPLGKALDVIGCNEYIGWYEGHPETADVTEWRVDYQKPLIVSEFGGGAKAGLHGGDNDRWSEEYQANIYRHQLGMLNRIPQLRGMSPWILMDFRSPNRVLAGIRDEFNRKGLISDQARKKLAFLIPQKAYKENTVGKPE